MTDTLVERISKTIEDLEASVEREISLFQDAMHYEIRASYDSNDEATEAYRKEMSRAQSRARIQLEVLEKLYGSFHEIRTPAEAIRRLSQYRRDLRHEFDPIIVMNLPSLKKPQV